MKYYVEELKWLQDETTRIHGDVAKQAQSKNELFTKIGKLESEGKKLAQVLDGMKLEELQNLADNVKANQKEFEDQKSSKLEQLEERDRLDKALTDSAQRLKDLDAELKKLKEELDEFENDPYNNELFLKYKPGYCKKVEYAKTLLDEMNATPEQETALKRYFECVAELEKIQWNEQPEELTNGQE